MSQVLVWLASSSGVVTSDDLPNDWTGIIVRVNPNATYDIFFDQESDRTPPAVNVLESEIERE